MQQNEQGSPDDAPPLIPFRLSPLTATDARAMFSWRYPPPFDFYDLSTGEMDEVLRGLLDPVNAYMAVRDAAGAFIGYGCLGPDGQVPEGDYRAEALDIGIGLRPDLTGRGLGPGVLALLLAEARSRWEVTTFRATIAAFNLRSQRLFARLGFREASRFTTTVNGRPVEWVIVTRPAGDDPSGGSGAGGGER